jgi:DNA-binding CsgD family transcriptional regulator
VKGPESENSHRKVLAVAREESALQLRRDANLNNCEIAEILGITEGGVRAALRRAMRRARERSTVAAEQLIADQEQKLMLMWAKVLPGIVMGHLASILAGLKILERWAKLRGVDAPSRMDLDVNKEWMRLYKLAQDEASEPSGQT